MKTFDYDELRAAISTVRNSSSLDAALHHAARLLADFTEAALAYEDEITGGAR